MRRAIFIQLMVKKSPLLSAQLFKVRTLGRLEGENP